jgi:uncharacterized protein with FMN-binding domain
MFRRRVIFPFVALASLLVALPLVAAEMPAAKSKATTTVDVLKPMTLAGQQLKPGTYSVSADDSTVTLQMNGKMVAQAPVQWKDEASKAQYSEVVAVDGVVKEIHFSGKMKYITIAQ